MEMWGGAGQSPRGLSPPPVCSAGSFLNWTRGRNFPVPYLPAGCGRCLVSSPSAKEVLENRKGFFAVLFREWEKREFVCVSVSEFAAYSNNSKTPYKG